MCSSDLLGALEGGIVANARYYEADGDGLDITPRGNSNVSGDDPKRSITASVDLDLGDLELRWAGFDYRHTYYTLDQDDPLDVLFQDEGDFWLEYHDQLASASYRLPIGRKLTITPRVSWRRHEDPGQYAWLGDPVTTATTDTDGTTSYDTTWDATLVETFKTTQAATAAVDLEANPAMGHTLVGGLGGEALFVDHIADLYYEDMSHEAVEGRYYAEPTTIFSAWAYTQDTWTVLSFLELTAGARLDWHGAFGLFPSPRAGVLLLPADGVVVKVLYGRAFRAQIGRAHV